MTVGPAVPQPVQKVSGADTERRVGTNDPVRESVGSVAGADAQLIEQLVSQYVEARLAGQNPAVTLSGADLTKADARNRALRTLMQGLASTAITAIVTGISTVADPHMLLSKDGWLVILTAAGVSVLTTVNSYLHRIAVEPTVKTPDGGSAKLIAVKTS